MKISINLLIKVGKKYPFVTEQFKTPSSKKKKIKHLLPKID